MSADKLLIQSDSQLVVGQVNEEYESRLTRPLNGKVCIPGQATLGQLFVFEARTHPQGLK